MGLVPSLAAVYGLRILFVIWRILYSLLGILKLACNKSCTLDSETGSRDYVLSSMSTMPELGTLTVVSIPQYKSKAIVAK